MTGKGERDQDLERTLDQAEWEWLREHALRDRVIVVSRKLDLLDVGRAMAQDRSKQIEEWVKQGILTKPTSQQLKEWDAKPKMRFLSLVVQPYVLIQELLLN